jgi:hypothetical protein
VYTKERLIALNTSYHLDHRVTDADVETINTLVCLIEAVRQRFPTVPIDGDRIMCISPKLGL